MRPLAVLLLAASWAVLGSAELAFKKEGKGPGTVLIHGFGGNRSVWAEQVARLKKDHTVLAIDLPGHGESGAPPMKDGAADLDAIAADIAALMRKQKVTPAIVVGHSTGGSIALRVALADPGAVKGVVLVDAILAPAEPAREEAFMKELDADAARTLGTFFGGLAADEEQKARALRDAARASVPALKAYRAARVTDTVGERAAGLKAPVAFFTSSTLIPDPAKEKEALVRLGMARIPKLTVSYFVNARHWIMWDEPDTFDVLYYDFEASLGNGR
jgi:pimeloyl-ACP methyl ester carboxylesterase